SRPQFTQTWESYPGSSIQYPANPNGVKHTSPAVASLLAPASYPGFVRHHVPTTLKAVAQSGRAQFPTLLRIPHSALRTRMTLKVVASISENRRQRSSNLHVTKAYPEFPKWRGSFTSESPSLDAASASCGLLERSEPIKKLQRSFVTQSRLPNSASLFSR